MKSFNAIIVTIVLTLSTAFFLSCNGTEEISNCHEIEGSSWKVRLKDQSFIFHFFANDQLVIQDYKKNAADSISGWGLVSFDYNKSEKLMHVSDDEYDMRCYTDSIILSSSNNGHIKMTRYSGLSLLNLTGLWSSYEHNSSGMAQYYQGQMDFEKMRFINSGGVESKILTSEHCPFILVNPRNLGYEILELRESEKDTLNARVVYGRMNLDIKMVKQQ